MEAYFAIGNCGSDDEEEVAPGQEKDLEEDPDGDMEEEHKCSDAQEVFDEWMLSLTKKICLLMFKICPYNLTFSNSYPNNFVT